MLATRASVAAVAAPIAAPVTDYSSLSAAKADGDKARGKTVMLHVTRQRMTADDVVLTAFRCQPADDPPEFHARFAPGILTLVRAIPAHSSRDCTRVIARIWPGGGLDGDILEVLDVPPPTAPRPPPPGVDFVSTDDMEIAGASGKIARIDVRRQAEPNNQAAHPPLFAAWACDVDEVAIEVHFRAHQSAFVNGISDAVSGPCTEVTVKLTKIINPHQKYWAAELLVP